MTRRIFVAVSISMTAALVVLVVTYRLEVEPVVSALFQGEYDHGNFQIESAQWSTPTLVAMVAKRSDRDALNNDTYFVVVGNHRYSPTELRQAYHAKKAIFSTLNDCLSLHWQEEHHLVVACPSGSIESKAINVQRYEEGDITVSYMNIPK